MKKALKTGVETMRDVIKGNNFKTQFKKRAG